MLWFSGLRHCVTKQVGTEASEQSAAFISGVEKCVAQFRLRSWRKKQQIHTNLRYISSREHGATRDHLRSHRHQKLKCYLRVTATRNSIPTAESPQREAQILLQSHCNEKLKSYFRVTAMRNSNPTSDSPSRETQILLQSHDQEELNSYCRVTPKRS